MLVPNARCFRLAEADGESCCERKGVQPLPILGYAQSRREENRRLVVPEHRVADHHLAGLRQANQIQAARSAALLSFDSAEMCHQRSRASSASGIRGACSESMDRIVCSTSAQTQQNGRGSGCCCTGSESVSRATNLFPFSGDRRQESQKSFDGPRACQADVASPFPVM